MAETRGYETINDRAGTKDAPGGNWGHADGDAPTADAAKQTTADRVAKSLAARKAFNEEVDPAIVDRTNGYGDIDLTAGSDGYGTSMETETPSTLADPADYKNGIFVDQNGEAEVGVGTNTAHTILDTAARADGRQGQAMKTVLDPEVGSIKDRTDGWGPGVVGADQATAAALADTDNDGTPDRLDTDIDDDTVLNDVDVEPYDARVQTVDDYTA